MTGDRDISTTLFHVADSETETAAGESMLAEAATELHDHGLSEDTITTEVVVSGSPVETIAEAAVAHDAVVMGEAAPSLGSFFFGETPELVASQSLGPVIVVRRHRDESS